MIERKTAHRHLKNSWSRILEISMMATILLMMGAVSWFPEMERKVLPKVTEKDYIPEEWIYIPTLPTIPPPPIKTKVVDKKEVNNDKPPVAIDNPIEETKSEANPEPEPTEPKGIGFTVEEDIWEPSVEVMPEPIGGMEAIRKAVVYPPFAIKDKISGRVVLRVFVDVNGHVKKVEVAKSVHPFLDEAAIQAVKKVKFLPGYQGGNRVQVILTVPIDFKLK